MIQDEVISTEVKVLEGICFSVDNTSSWQQSVSHLLVSSQLMINGLA